MVELAVQLSIMVATIIVGGIVIVGLVLALVDLLVETVGLPDWLAAFITITFAISLFIIGIYLLTLLWSAATTKIVTASAATLMAT